MQLTTYSARFLDGDQSVIYKNQPNGNLIGQLPLGSFPVATGTLERPDGGDPFEHAVFHTPSGRKLAITRDAAPGRLEIIVAVDWANGTLKVLSNCQALPVVLLNVSDPDPECTDAAEARLAGERLHVIEEMN